MIRRRIPLRDRLIRRSWSISRNAKIIRSMMRTSRIRAFRRNTISLIRRQESWARRNSNSTLRAFLKLMKMKLRRTSQRSNKAHQLQSSKAQLNQRWKSNKISPTCLLLQNPMRMNKNPALFLKLPHRCHSLKWSATWATNCHSYKPKLPPWPLQQLDPQTTTTTQSCSSRSRSLPWLRHLAISLSKYPIWAVRRLWSRDLQTRSLKKRLCNQRRSLRNQKKTTLCQPLAHRCKILLSRMPMARSNPLVSMATAMASREISPICKNRKAIKEMSLISLLMNREWKSIESSSSNRSWRIRSTSIRSGRALGIQTTLATASKAMSTHTEGRGKEWEARAKTDSSRCSHTSHTHPEEVHPSHEKWDMAISMPATRATELTAARGTCIPSSHMSSQGRTSSSLIWMVDKSTSREEDLVNPKSQFNELKKKKSKFEKRKVWLKINLVI